MGQRAPRVFTQSDAIRRLEALINQLPNDATVTVQCEDGQRISGIVCIRPTVQSFRDQDGREGINGVLRLEVADALGGERHIWLDQVTAVQRRVGSGSNSRAA